MSGGLSGHTYANAADKFVWETQERYEVLRSAGVDIDPGAPWSRPLNSYEYIAALQVMDMNAKHNERWLRFLHVGSELMN